MLNRDENKPMLIASTGNIRTGDHVLVSMATPIAPFATALASIFRGAAYTLLIDEDQARRNWNSSSLRGIATQYFNRSLYKYASRIIVNSCEARELMEKATAGLDIPIEVIPDRARSFLPR